MINVVVPLDGVDQFIIHPLVKQVAIYLRDNFFDSKDSFINLESSDTTDSFSTNIDAKDQNVKREFLNVSFNYSIEQYLPYNHPSYLKHYLLDKNNGLTISPMLKEFHFTFTITYSSISKNRISRLINFYTSRDKVYQIPINYDIMLPDPLPKLLDNISSLYGVSTDVYLDRLDLVSREFLISRYQEDKTLSFREEQYLQVYLPELETKKDISKEDNMYQVEFTFEANVILPQLLYVRYPFLISNKPISSDFIPEDNILKIVESATYSQEAFLEAIEAKLETDYIQDHPIITVPGYDRLDLSIPPKHGMSRLLSLTLILEDDYLLLDIDDMLSIIGNDLVKSHMRNNENLLLPYRDVIYIEISENDGLIHFTDLYIEDNKIYSRQKLNKDSIYRVILNLVYDIDLLELYKTTPLIDDYLSLLKEMESREIKSDKKLFYTVMTSYIIVTVNN